jgi:hypothetical protein
MGLVLWIDENSLSTSLVQRVFKRRGLPFYSLTEIRDFTFLIEDLKPALLVLDAATFQHHKDMILSQYSSSLLMQQIPVVVLGAGEEMGWIRNKAGQILKPFDPFEVPDVLLKILSVN